MLIIGQVRAVIRLNHKQNKDLKPSYSIEKNVKMQFSKQTIKLIYKFAYKYAHKPEDADDIAQESFMLLLTNPPKDDILPNQFYAQIVRWGRSACYTYSYTHKGKSYRESKNLLLDYNEDSQEKMYMVASEYDLENIVILRDVRRKQRKHIFSQKLTANEIKVISACFDMDLAVGDMAEELGMGINTFSTHYGSAVKKLRKMKI